MSLQVSATFNPRPPLCSRPSPDPLTPGPSLSLSLCSVYSGHQSILIPPVELESNPALWLLAVSQLRVRDTFCSYSVMELCTKGLGLQTEALKVRGHSVHFETLSQEVRGQRSNTDFVLRGTFVAVFVYFL